jgi:hypothetical protein
VESRFLLLNFHLENRAGTLLAKFALYYHALLLRPLNTRSYIGISYDFSNEVVLAQAVWYMAYFVTLLVTQDYTASNLV